MTDGWIQHGDSDQRDLVKMLLPERGVHFMVSKDSGATRALTAEMAVAVAGGELPSLQNGGGENFRLLRGFMNLPVGKPRAVAVVGATDRDHINVAAALRCVTTQLPIYVRADAKRELAANGFGYKLRENNIALVIVAMNLGEKDGLDLARQYGIFANETCVLIVTPSEPPKHLLSPATRVMRIVDGMGEGHLALEVEGEAIESGWGRDFSLEAVDMGDDRVAWIVRVESSSSQPPVARRAAPEAPQAKHELVYAGHVVYWRSGYGLHPLEAERWPEGAIFAEQPQDVALAAKEIDGRVQVIVALAPDSKCDPNEERRRVQTACALASIGERVDVGLASQTLLDARDVRAA
jgi:hypothetical protein